MALLTSSPEPRKTSSLENINTKKQHPSKRRKKQQQQQPQKNPPPTSSWDQIKNLLTCRQIEGSKVHDPSSTSISKLGSSCSSICTFRDVVVDGNVASSNNRVVHRADNSPESSSVSGQQTRHLSKKSAHGSSSRSLSSSIRSSKGSSSTTTYNNGSCRGMQFRKLSGCYECRTIVDPSRYPLPRTTICACSECGEVFPKIESLEHHQAVRHAVAELGPEDSSRNIVEIIFKSSWLKKDNPICSIERILKIHNTKRTIQRFEDCRDAVKIRANSNNKKNPRCAADGNELLRFYCTSLTCSLGSRGSTSLCGSIPGCGVCTVIRHGFQGNKTTGVRTTASSGRAHDCLVGTDIVGCGKRAMLVCRVIAGKVKRMADDAAAPEEDADTSATGSYDSVAGYAGTYSNLEELYVFNPKAILPCFVVIYKALES
ncbi:hypothetical protein ACH5RR_027478 [Cinchona calisaya]|uniref:C2H2-type domain-containing protein n=1 Tax=Cinchona calisaya TaxID=153742 RepID=A0ABD2Z5L9_9GENT